MQKFEYLCWLQTLWVLSYELKPNVTLLEFKATDKTKIPN